MLDSGARKFVQPFFSLVGGVLARAGVHPDSITLAALIVGLGSSALFFFGGRWSALLLLWFSGVLDVLDGSVARIGGRMSPFGALMDLVFDRIVEIGFIIAVSLRFPQARLVSVLLLSSIIFSFSVFLAVGALAASSKRSEKAFYYQAGLAERTETFLVFSVVMIWPESAPPAFAIFTAMIVFTGAQRMREAYIHFGRSNNSDTASEEGKNQ
jgi:phosphatidylglycerophosphate synthase